MFVEFYTTLGIRVQVLEVSVVIGKNAFVQAYAFLPTGLTLFKLQMMDQEYSAWGSDDNFVKQFICDKIGVIGNPADSDGVIAPIMSNSDDARSIHNPSDLEAISSLQTQLDEQKKKLETIMGLLVKSGSL